MSRSDAPRVYKRPVDRHYIPRVRWNSRIREVNTVIEPWVDVAADVAAISSGIANREGNDFSIGERRYGVEENDRLYPIDGAGFHQLDRQAYKALVAYNRFGYGHAAKAFIMRSSISRQQHAAALWAWCTGRRGSR